MNQNENITLTQEELDFIQQYENQYSNLAESDFSDITLYEKAKAGDFSAKELLARQYMPKILETAMTHNRADIFIGDLVQEGSVGLAEGLGSFTEPQTAHEEILHRIEKCMRIYLLEMDSMSELDDALIEKVREMDEALTCLKEDLGRKVYVEEIAEYMNISEEEVQAILQLTGEEISEEEDLHEHEH